MTILETFLHDPTTDFIGKKVNSTLSPSYLKLIFKLLAAKKIQNTTAKKYNSAEHTLKSLIHLKGFWIA